MASKKILWVAESVADLLTTELNNAADATVIVDATDYNNATNKYQFGSFFFKATAFDAQANADAIVELHLFYRLDGTNYADGEEGDAATPVATANSHHGVFIIGATAGPVFQQILNIPLMPFAFRAAIKMATGQDLTAVATHFLKMYPHNNELQ